MAPDVSAPESALDPVLAPGLTAADWRRIRDALRYQARDLHHRSYAVHGSRRSLLWEEMDHCLALADRLEQALAGEVLADHDPAEQGLEGALS